MNAKDVNKIVSTVRNSEWKCPVFEAEVKDDFKSFIERTEISFGAYQGMLKIGYLEAPASKGHHLAEKGGLVTHSVNVTRELLKLTETMGVEWPREESPYLVGLLHDLVKCRCYRAMDGAARDGEGEDNKRTTTRWENGESKRTTARWEYVQPEYPGHGIASVMIAAELGIELRPEEIAAITYHMGMFGVGREYTEEEFNAALAKFPQQIIATHCADWWAARVTEGWATSNSKRTTARKEKHGEGNRD